MERKSQTALSAEFGINKCLKSFSSLPYQPPKGKEVLERLYGAIEDRTSIFRSSSDVTRELIDLWTKADSGIPLKTTKWIRTKILKLNDEFETVKKTSWKNRSSYQKTVSKFVIVLNLI